MHPSLNKAASRGSAGTVSGLAAPQTLRLRTAMEAIQCQLDFAAGANNENFMELNSA